MTKAEKRIFIRDLIRSVKTNVLNTVPEMPDNWDGIELRQYLADKFADASLLTRPIGPTSQHLRRRKKNYKNDVLVRNL